MSTQITTAFVQQFTAGIDQLVQQKGSRIRSGVRVEPDITGKWAFFDQVGATAMSAAAARHADTAYTTTPHSRRRVALADYEVADLIDDFDKVKVLTDPTNSYSQSFANAAGRNIDDVIIAAASGNAQTGETGSSAVALPAGQKIAHGSAGLTLAKLIEAKKILDENEVDSEDRTIVVSAAQLEDLLNLATVTSADYNSVKALVRGEVDTYLGFSFVRSERLAVASSVRKCLAFAKGAMLLGIGLDTKGRISEMPNKRYSTQVYYSHSIGAVRMEEEGVVEISCSE